MRFVIEIPDELVTRGANGPAPATPAVAALSGALSGGAAPQHLSRESSDGTVPAADAGAATGGAATLLARSAVRAPAAAGALDGGGAPAHADVKRKR